MFAVWRSLRRNRQAVLDPNSNEYYWRRQDNLSFLATMQWPPEPNLVFWLWIRSEYRVRNLHEISCFMIVSWFVSWLFHTWLSTKHSFPNCFVFACPHSSAWNFLFLDSDSTSISETPTFLTQFSWPAANSTFPILRPAANSTKNKLAL